MSRRARIEGETTAGASTFDNELEDAESLTRSTADGGLPLKV